MSQSQHSRHDRNAKATAGGAAPAECASRGTPAKLGAAALALWMLVLLGWYETFPLPSLPKKPDGQPFVRADFLAGWLIPDELLRQWFGEKGSWSLADRIPLVVTAGIMGLAALALGEIMLRALGLVRGKCLGERLALAWLTGAQAQSLYTLAVGLCGGLSHRWLFLLPGAAAIVLAAMALWRERRAPLAGKSNPICSVQSPTSPPWRELGPHESEPLSTWWTLLGIPFALALILGGMLPPVDFDVREYHLQIPKEWHQAGRIRFVPHNVYGNMPLGAEMHALLAMCLTGDWFHGALAGKLTLAFFPMLAAAGVYAAAKRWRSGSAGVFAAIAYISIPWVVRVSAAGLIDAVLGAYLFFAWYAVARALEALAQEPARSREPDRQALSHDVARWLIVAGWLTGGAVSCKYPAVLWGLIPLAFWIVQRFVARGETARGARLAVLFVAVSAGSCGLWLAKNAVFTGNPTYPLLDEVFGEGDRAPEQIAQWNAAHRPHGFALEGLLHGAWNFLIASEWQTPFLLLLCTIPLRRSAPNVRAMLAYLAFYLTAWWLLTHRIDRFWVPLLPIAVLLTAVLLPLEGDRWRLYAYRGFVILALASNWIFCTLPGAGNDARFLAPLAELRKDPARVKRWHLDLNEAYAKNPRMKVLCVGEAMVFDLEMPVEYATTFDRSPWAEVYLEEGGPTSQAKPRDPRAVLAALRERGVTHVFVDWGEIARYRSPGNYGFAEFVTPESFDELVRRGTLRPPRRLPENPGELYAVP